MRKTVQALVLRLRLYCNIDATFFFLFSMQRRRYLLHLASHLPSESPIAKDWPHVPRHLRETNNLLRRCYHKWRVRREREREGERKFSNYCDPFGLQCYRFRLRFDQIARNRMREKVTASIIFKDRKVSYGKR